MASSSESGRKQTAIATTESDLKELEGQTVLGALESEGDARRATYFKELLNIVVKIGNNKRQVDDDGTRGSAYYEQQAKSWDLIYSDSRLEFYLGALDAAANVDLLFGSTGEDHANSDFAQHDSLVHLQQDGYNKIIAPLAASSPLPPSSCWKDFDVERIVQQVEATVAELHEKAALKPPPLASGAVAGAPPPPPPPPLAAASGKAQGSTTSRIMGPRAVAWDAKDLFADIAPTDSVPVPKPPARLAAKPPVISCRSTTTTTTTTTFGGLINLCGFDKPYVRANTYFPVEQREEYVGNAKNYYHQRWTNRVLASRGAESGRNMRTQAQVPPTFIPVLKSPPYLEIAAVDKESYNITQHFSEIDDFIRGNLEKISQNHVLQAAEKKSINSGVVQPASRVSSLPEGPSAPGDAEVSISTETANKSSIERAPPVVARFFIHCVVGSNRSGCCACAFLMRYNRWTAKQAISVVAWKRRVRILLNQQFLSALIDYEDQLRAEGLLGSA